MSSDGQYWEALEILAEDRKRYKIKWAGIDADTGEPWEDSWTLKEYVTDDLINSWTRKKELAAKQKREKRATTSSSTSKSVTARKSRVTRGKHSRESSEDVQELESEEEPRKPAKKPVPTVKGKGKERARPAKVAKGRSESDHKIATSHSRSHTRSTRSGGNVYYHAVPHTQSC